MMSKFQIGEMAIFIGGAGCTDGLNAYAGEDVEIRSQLGATYRNGYARYKAIMSDGEEANIAEHVLKKKPLDPAYKKFRDKIKIPEMA